MGKRLYLVRHATSRRARIGVWGRLVDAPLEDGFAAQLSRTRADLASVPDPAVFSSPLRRCRETARLLIPDRPVHVVDEFRAYHSGVFEGETVAFVAQHHPEYLGRSYRQRFLRPEFGEESIADQTVRVARGLLDVLEADAEASVVVAHYSTINIVAHVSALNWDRDTYADGVYDVADGEYIVVSIDPAAIRAGLRDKFGVT